MTTDDGCELARTWLRLAYDLGWGVEGPERADEVRSLVRAIAHGDDVDPRHRALLQDARAAAPLGRRPVDALLDAADLLLEAAAADGPARAAALSGARGWLDIAGRSGSA